ncbi:uncharacterized protein KNAG_0A04400 [Huiozyma naganishii CBS 8797]|uniref:Svf1-like C-terminal domain-containing protein n=1 Tax=Huiozyma naganishii (strain ATCC MYA-139 / BCRC 22969 / CBS 8797 / KCTC 17520 / NBRC 10181 / NCYC 3082 / Yp74L-3) TaxID=1071383 RepID=J7S2D7_HUIN7|nr:hypothetical protein KNAG_0A04400 [Kazachstania naganishii CBS 8797]CCK68114.1 hypothetical protein KNAG_0A04400 [Kazachstania naganishii CBS 8797]
MPTDTVRFLPLGPVIPPSKENVTAVSKLEDLAWYMPTHHKNLHKKRISILGGGKNGLTSVETQTLYFIDLENELSGFVQILYSLVLGGIYKGFQINFKMFSHLKEKSKEIEIWESIKLDDASFKNNELSVVGNGITFELRELPNKNLTHTNKEHSSTELFNVANLKIKIDIPKMDIKIDLRANLGEGFKINPDGCSYYLEKATKYQAALKEDVADHKKYMRHQYIPNGKCRGKIQYRNGANKHIQKIKLHDVSVIYLDAVQGLLPNKAAKRWNFLYFQSANYSVVCMEYTTPDDYDAAKVTTWALSSHGIIQEVGSKINDSNIIKFDNVEEDAETGWKYPMGMTFTFPSADKEQALSIKDMNMVNRYDILGELPGIIRKLASNIARINPYLYQYCQSAKFNDEEGVCIVESTFIS